MGKHYDHPMQRMNILTEQDTDCTGKPVEPPKLTNPIVTTNPPTYELPWAAEQLGWDLDDELSFCPDKENDRIIITRTQVNETN